MTFEEIRALVENESITDEEEEIVLDHVRTCPDCFSQDAEVDARLRRICNTPHEWSDADLEALRRRLQNITRKQPEERGEL